MPGTMEWADLNRLLEHDFHHYTQVLYELESELRTPIHDSLHWSRRFEYPWIIQQMLGANRSSVLDAGAGATALQFFLARSGIPTTSIDIDQSAVDWVSSRPPQKFWAPAKENGTLELAGGPKPVAAAAKLPELPFPNKVFGTSICVSVLEHLPRQEVLPSIWNLLRVSEGNVLVTMDICLGTSDQVDVSTLLPLLQALNVPAKPLPPTALTFDMHGHRFAVACLNLTPDPQKA